MGKQSRMSVSNGKAGKMQRQQSSLPMETISAEKTAAQTLQEYADIEALRAAYRAVVTASAHSAFAANAVPGIQQQPSEPLLNAYHAAVNAFANSVLSANGMPTTQNNLSSAAFHANQTASAIPSHPSIPAAASRSGSQGERSGATGNNPALAQPKNTTATMPGSIGARPLPAAQTSNTSSRPADRQPGKTVKENLFYTHLNPNQPNTDAQRQTHGQPSQPASRQNAITGKQAAPLPAVPETLYDTAQTPGKAKKYTFQSNASNYTPEFDIELPEKEKTESPSFPAVEPDRQPANSGKGAEVIGDATRPGMNNTSIPPLLDDEYEFLDLSPIPESWLVKLFTRPKLAAGIIGICVLTSSVYAGLGLWWLNNGSPISQAAEPVNMLNIDESEQIHRDNKSLFKNIDSIQQHNIIVPNESDSHKAPQRDLLAMAPAPSKTFDLQDIKRSISEPTGRPDPFEPLLGLNGEKQGPPEEMQKRDILEDLQFTGFIGDINSKNKVAIIKVNDAVSGATKTLIKKTGQTFMVEGEKVVLKAISKGSLLLSVSGETRVLSLNPYVESVASSSNSTSQSAAGGGNAAPSASGTVAPASSGSAMGGSLGNIRALSGNRNPANPQLEEPN